MDPSIAQSLNEDLKEEFQIEPNAEETALAAEQLKQQQAAEPIEQSEEEKALAAKALEQKAEDDNPLREEFRDENSKSKVEETEEEKAVREKAEETKNQEIAEQESIKIINENFGTSFTSQEEIAAFRAKITEIDKEKEDLATIKNNVVNPFANDDVRKYNEFTKETGISNMTVFQKLNDADVSKLDPIAAMVLSKTIKNPHYIGKEELLRRTIEKKYDVDSIEDEDDKEIAKMNIQIDAEAAISHLSDLKAKIPESFDDKSGEILAEQERIKSDWSSKIDTMVSQSLNIVITEKDKDGKEVELLKYDASKEEMEPYIQEVAKRFVKDGLEFSDENSKNLIKIATGFYKSDNISKMIVAAKNVAVSKGKQDAIRDIHNPSKPEIKSNVEHTEKTDSDFQKFTQDLLNR